MMLKKSIPLFLVLSLSLSQLSACTNKDGGNQAAGDAGATVKEQKQEPVDLYFYSTSGLLNEEDFMKVFGSKIKEKFPHVTPKFIVYGKDTTMDKLMVNNQTIDIFFDSMGATVQKYELEYDISDLIKKNSYDLGRLEPSSVEIQRQIAKGGIYGFPVFTAAPTVYYNKDLFDRFGVPYPKDGMTWDEMFEISKKMSRTDGGRQYWGTILSLQHVALLNQFSAPLVDPKTNKSMVATDKFKTVFETFTRFYSIPGNQPDSKTVAYGKQLEMFEKDQTVAMYLGMSSLGAIRFKNNFNWDVFAYPEYKEMPGIGPQTYPTYFYVTKTSKAKDQAFQVISYLTSDEMQKHVSRNGMFPTLKSRDALKEYGKDIDYLKSRNIQGFLPNKFAPPVEATKYQGTAFTHLNAAFTDVLLGTKDVNTALREAEEKANKDIEADLKNSK
ncbi:extracellular solute-binding protein [Paenibacillus mesophilus]|uniref:ABC transporter substrate-binding protein n=1 Tax=Paenibacillus mesophilus TaxID=2582849 RepID=UPI00110F6475|nr:extracellular solute-binding protein [Paenibacillus mesophilus]TMV52666.1 extracellular solute-binding protein [Paenibacillus mesophilus]